MPKLGSKERAIVEAMELHGLDRKAAERFIDEFTAAWERHILGGSPSNADDPPVGLFGAAR
jgi:hypothetical protein